MRLPRMQLMIKAMMILAAIAAIWAFIIAEAITYQARHPGDPSAWDDAE